MGAAVERLTKLVDAENRYSIPWSDLLPLQIEAANERLTERLGAIKLLANRAETGGVKTIRDAADIVPLLFAHTSYKSYPENWFTQGKWDRMSQWLGTLTSHPVPRVDVKDVTDVDQWVDKMAECGHYLNCSSGTTGKCSIIPASMADRTFIKRNMTVSITWSTGIAPRQQYKTFGLTPTPRTFRNDDSRAAIVEPFANADRPFPGERITVGQVSKMVMLRRSIADGTARPADIAAFEEVSKSREKMIQDSLQSTAEAIVADRDKPILIQGMLATMFQITELVRGMGYRAKDFHPENMLLTGGGLKGAKLPADYREIIVDTFNIAPKHTYQFYSMQEINTVMPRCSAGRYHVAPWLMLLLLDQTGEQLIRPERGEVEGRAAFLDLSLDGRWGGLISGDKVRVDYGKCACGHEGPSVHGEIVRYNDLPGGDKISCAGTIDAYIRGAA